MRKVENNSVLEQKVSVRTIESCSEESKITKVVSQTQPVEAGERGAYGDHPNATLSSETKPAAQILLRTEGAPNQPTVVHYSVREEELAVMKKSELAAFNNIYVADPLTPESAGIAAEAGAEVITTFVHDEVSDAVLAQLPQLQGVAQRATGYDKINLGASSQQGVKVFNVPEYGSRTVAEFAAALMMGAKHEALFESLIPVRTPAPDASSRTIPVPGADPAGAAECAFAVMLITGRKLTEAFHRTERGNFQVDGLLGHDLQSLQLTVIGEGPTGAHAAHIAEELDMEVDFVPVPDTTDPHRMRELAIALEESVSEADYLLLEASVSTELRAFVEKTLVRIGKKDALIIAPDPARGEAPTLVGQKMLVVGGGRIGLNVAQLAKSFGMEVTVVDPYPNPEVAKQIGFRYGDFDNAAADADVVSLNVPLTPHTHHLIDAAALDKVKEGALLINTARGAVVDTRALREALEDGRIASAVLDCFEGENDLIGTTDALEQAPEVNALIARDDVIITPTSLFLPKKP